MAPRTVDNPLRLQSPGSAVYFYERVALRAGLVLVSTAAGASAWAFADPG